MLIRSTPERALGALLGGELAANKLYEHLAELSKAVAALDSPCKSYGKEEERPASQKKAAPSFPALRLGALRNELHLAIQAEIDQRTGRAHRLNESQMAASRLCDQPFLENAEIPALDDLNHAILVDSGRGLHFRDVHVQRYAEVLSELDPTLLAAWHLVKRTASKGQGKQSTLEKSVAELTTLFVGSRFDSLPFAETHVHLNGIAGDDVVLAQIILGHKCPSIDTIHSQQDANQFRRIRRIRRSLMVLVGIWGHDDAVDSFVADERIIDLLKACWDDAELVASNPTIDWDFMERGIVIKGEGAAEVGPCGSATADEGKQPVTSKWLLQRLAGAARKHEFQRAWCWLFILLLRTYRIKKNKPVMRALVLLMVADMMVLRRQMLMNGHGLRRFTTDFFHSPLRTEAAFHEKWQETSMGEAARRLFAKTGDKAEIKICSGSLKARDAALAFARAVHAHILTLANKSGPPSASSGFAFSRSHWHFCVHFNRVKDSSRPELWKQARGLRDLLRSVDRWDLGQPCWDSQGSGTSHFVLPAELIRGLDVVGDETRWSIEMFAPMLRWLRKTTGTRDPLSESSRSQEPILKLHLSIHAGEDYAHPLSGLRNVDEAVQFCDMRAGDRLGHALSLGIPPDEWLERHGETLLSVDEHVDNLVWAWRKAVELRFLKEARRVRPRLESRIARMLPYVSWFPWKKETPAPTWLDLKNLYGAWALRKNCAHMAVHQIHTGITDSKLDAGVPDIVRLREHVKHPSITAAEGLYLLRARHLESRPPTEAQKPVRHVRLTVMPHHCVTRGQRRLESFDTGGVTYLHDHDDADDLRFMLALQDACIERYRKLGLSIETNPSSNVYIGQLQTHSDHPIYRWNPPNRSDLEYGARFNQFNLRKQPIPVTVNTDDPGMIPTTLRMEYHLIHEAAISRGHSKQVADMWVEEIRQRGMMHFEDAH
ncbi:antiviral RADAR system adenosine deaminase RdrB [Pseudomonas putida]|uniref:antiviral RADAR system adenosine deaminase RdrB n=1 Tax=Pseudomonas putida TaxID=303 RepID=UPI003305FA14